MEACFMKFILSQQYTQRIDKCQWTTAVHEKKTMSQYIACFSLLEFCHANQTIFKRWVSFKYEAKLISSNNNAFL